MTKGSCHDQARTVLSAALVLGRALRRVLVIDPENSTGNRVTHAHGSIPSDGAASLKQVADLRSDALAGGAHFLKDTVTRVSTRLSVTTAEGLRLQARRVLVATGAVDAVPELTDAREWWGRGLYRCPHGHGFELRDRPLAVLASGEQAVSKALLLSRWSADVTLVHGPDTFLSTADRLRLDTAGVRLHRGDVQGPEPGADGRLRGIRFGDGRLLVCDAVFIGDDPRSADRTLRELGCRLGLSGRVAADRDGVTSVPGVYAAGAVLDPFSQPESATGDGYRVALALNESLLEEDLRGATDVFSPAMERLVAKTVDATRRHGLS
ncbi:NAD(P)/FAD-dependent oxidoreductase [Streptomyces canus]|uniref:NAD(P)/FAD-dependent oxidoreductase n=1 Tax=Streptomyces canus TaxID=58343 RepID=UPI003CED85B8